MILPSVTSADGALVHARASSLPVSPEEAWKRHATAQTRSILLAQAVALGTTILLAMLLDITLSPLGVDAVTPWGTPLQLFACVFGAVTLRWWPPAQQNPLVVGAIASAILCGSAGHVLGRLGGFDGPFFYLSYLLTCYALPLPVGLPWRLISTYGCVGVFLYFFFLGHPEYVGVEYSYIAWAHLTFMLVAVPYVGHANYRAIRDRFLLRHQALRQKAQDNLLLSEEVGRNLEKLTALSDRMEHVRAEERALLAQALHDDMGQLLVGARAELDNAERALRAAEGEASLERALREVRELRRSVDAIAKSTRGVIHTLHDTEIPFEVAVEDLVEAFRAVGQVEIALTLKCPEWDPEPEQYEVCLRVVQEALTNTLRHAGADSAFVSLVRRDGALHLSVEDDGGGIQDGPRRSGGFGLMGMKQRVESVGGTFGIGTGERGGVRIEVVLPLANGRKGSLER